MEERTMQCYVNVDEHGNIRNGQQGEYIIPSEDWDFFFLLENEVDLALYRVEMNGMKKSLTLKEGSEAN